LVLQHLRLRAYIERLKEAGVALNGRMLP
jgi:hypothetical protein